ncbi:MAG: DUF3883 domain-containing protein [Planctomycetes bacterium]|nr:DUF3883 domain-containing protein [Planctomycetota bacterium]
MARLEDLKKGALVRGITPSGAVKIIDVEFIGDQAANVTFEDTHGSPARQLLYRDAEASLELVARGRQWSFDGDGDLLRLAAEAQRIKLAHLFDPYLAIHTSKIDPLPHQIVAVYEEMLLRQPLRFLLADDPGAGKTIMAGLFIKELMIRGDLERCLVVAPGNLVEQWQEELGEKFGLEFDLLTRDLINATRTGNPLTEKNLLIARLDMLSRNVDLQERMQASNEWDLVVVDEAHKMSASRFGNEVKRTKRFQLGQLLGQRARHFLLMTATPHNGKPDDFDLFMSLLDGDRFEGKPSDGVHKADVSDLMRRMIKEELVTFEGKPLFPERKAYTVTYKLSEPEQLLYGAVTDYVREEMNRVERFAEEDNRRRMNVGFALQILQRRLASSPLAIFRSIKRRKERLERRLLDEKAMQKSGRSTLETSDWLPAINEDFWDEIDDAPEAEVEEEENRVIDQATAARTIEELQTEIGTLKVLEEQAKRVLQAEQDTKWSHLQQILDAPLMTDRDGNRRKLIIFTEPKDSVEYLTERIKRLLGKDEAVVVIHGGVGREARRNIVESFRHNADTLIMVANDAACEGINLQRAHLMINYDLPWNPNKLEQRFGRIHRIGQKEVCHVWNLVAIDTREGHVFHRLLEKLEEERKALQGRVYDVLGQLFEAEPLRELLMRAIRYGEDPEVRAKLEQKIDGAVNLDRIRALLEERALVKDTMSAEKVLTIRDEMERAEARRLQPHFIQSFFMEAFDRLGGHTRKREPERWEVTRVPARVMRRDRQIGTGAAVQPKYERMCFKRNLVNQSPVAAYLAPGHPLLESVIDITLELHRDVLKTGATLVDEKDEGNELRVLFFLEQSVQNGMRTHRGEQQVIARELLFMEIDRHGNVRDAGPAPYLNYRKIGDDEKAKIASALNAEWLSDALENRIMGHAIQHSVPRMVQRVKSFHLPLLQKTELQVQARLTREINHWSYRAADLEEKEKAGKKPRLNSALAKQRAENLARRLEQRLAEIALQQNIKALPPVIKGGCLVVPVGLLRQAGSPNTHMPDAEARKAVELAAMKAVIAAELSLGNVPRDVSSENVGWDVESRDGRTKRLRFIEVKGRAKGADTVTVTRNEILQALNEPDSFILALVQVDGDDVVLRYLREPFRNEPDFGVTSVNYAWQELWNRSGAPA